VIHSRLICVAFVQEYVSWLNHNSLSAWHLDTSSNSWDLDDWWSSWERLLGCASHVSFMSAPRLIHMRDMIHLHVCHVSSTCVPWLIQVCYMTHSYVWHDLFTYVPGFIHICAMTHSYVWYDSESRCCRSLWGRVSDILTTSWVREGARWDLCVMTHSYVCHDSFTFVLGLIRMCAMHHSYLWKDSESCCCRALWDGVSGI